jgi:Transposase domain (DUF772)
MRMMLLLFLDDIKSERELMRIIPERLDYLWFLGYGLDDEIPDHSVLSKARKRWGQEVFVSLFSRVVHQWAASVVCRPILASRLDILQPVFPNCLQSGRHQSGRHGDISFIS